MCIVVGGLINYSSTTVVVMAEEPPAPVIESVEVIIEVEYDAAGIERLIRETFPEDPHTAVAIAKAESGLVSEAYNPEAHIGCNGSIGIFQIACVHTSNKESLKEVEVNIKKAREIYLKQGWSPWGAYTNGSYRKYL